MIEEAETDDANADEAYREAASELWCKENLQIDDGALVSQSDDGAWVQAWVWVSKDRAGVSVEE